MREVHGECMRGHRLTEENVYHRLRGGIRCRECNRDNQARRYRRARPGAKIVRVVPDLDPYVPIDEILAHPTTKILRTASHFDGINAVELLEAIGVQDFQPGGCNKARQTYLSAIVGLVKCGYLAKTGSRSESVSSVRYSVTESGRLALAKRLESSIASLDAIGME